MLSFGWKLSTSWMEVTASRWYYIFCRPWRSRAFLILPIILVNKYPISSIRLE